MASRTVLAVAAFTLAGCGGDGDDSSAIVAADEKLPPFKRTVVIKDNEYKPAYARILVGGSITWVNRDPDHFHTAVSEASDDPDRPWAEKDAFDTHTLTWDERYTIDFHKPGTYIYRCSFHDMEGRVRVMTRLPPKVER